MPPVLALGNFILQLLGHLPGQNNRMSRLPSAEDNLAVSILANSHALLSVSLRSQETPDSLCLSYLQQHKSTLKRSLHQCLCRPAWK